LHSECLICLVLANDYKGFPFYYDLLVKAGLDSPYDQYGLYLTVGGAIYASWTPVRKAIYLSKHLHETDPSLKKIWAARANLSQVELEGGPEYLKELKRIPRRYSTVPLVFVLVEGYRKFKSVYFNR